MSPGQPPPLRIWQRQPERTSLVTDFARKTVVVVGSGGREAALVDWLRHVPGLRVVITPGNPGIPGSVATQPEDIEADLYIVGPEAPLVDGLADRLRKLGRRVLGPGTQGAMLEGSKIFMKEVVTAAGVPTANWAAFDDPDEAEAYLRGLPQGTLYVIKTDYLAQGKGVLVTRSLANAIADARAKLAKGRIIVEVGMTSPDGSRGRELSLMAVCDGRDGIAVLPFAQDYKPLYDEPHPGDNPNTGGIGSFAPVADVPDGNELAGSFVRPILAELRRRGIDYRGVLYIGLMLTAEGWKLVEINIRFGDPETQSQLPTVTPESFLRVCWEAADGLLDSHFQLTGSCVVTLVLCAQGYAIEGGQVISGEVISGLDAATEAGATILYSGVSDAGEHKLATAGGRVLGVRCTGRTIAEARRRAYGAARCINWASGPHLREQIAADV